MLATNIFGYIGSVTLSCMNYPLVKNSLLKENPSFPPNQFMILNMSTCLCFIIYGIGIAIDTDIVSALPMIIPNIICVCLVGFVWHRKKMHERLSLSVVK